jgi:microcystin-dependent protein
MKKLKIETGGRPLANDDLQVIQDQLNVLEKMLAEANPAFIVQGCEINTGVINAGIVCIGGKLLELEQQTISMSGDVYIISENLEEYSPRTYQNGQTKDTLTRQKAILSNAPATPSIKISNGIKPLSFAKDVKIGALKKGTIVEVDSEAITQFNIIGNGLGTGEWEGWAFCDGRNGTPDLRKMFIVGLDTAVGRTVDADYDTIGKTGGAKQVTLTKNQMPKHDHSQVKDINGLLFDFDRILHYSQNGTYPNTSNVFIPATAGSLDASMNRFEPILTDSVSLKEEGNDEDHENRPPFYVLARVKRII